MISIFLVKRKLKYCLNLGSRCGDKLHCPSSLPQINVVGNTKCSSSNLHRRRWVNYQRFVVQPSSSTTSRAMNIKFFFIFIAQSCELFYVGKDVKIKYASSTLSHGIKFFFAFKIVIRNKKCKGKMQNIWRVKLLKN